MRPSGAAGIAFLAVLVPVAAAAQQFGQWSWEAEVGAGEMTYSNYLAGIKVGDYSSADYRALLRVNGFVLHPTVGIFQLELNGIRTDYEGSDSVDENRLGYGGQLRLFPRGRYPMSFYARRDQYDYRQLTVDNPLILRGLPDMVTTWGGVVRLRHGPLRGATIGLNSSRTDFLGEEKGDHSYDRQFVHWSGTSGEIRHHYRLEHRNQEYAGGFSTDDYTLNGDQGGRFREHWSWNASQVAIRRQFSGAAGPSEIDALRVSGRVNRPYASGNHLDFTLESGLNRSPAAPTAQSHLFNARYLWRTRRGWQLYPSGGYGLQTLNGQSVHSPAVSLGVSRTFRRGSLTATLHGAGSYRYLRRRQPAGEIRTSTFGSSLSLSLVHGKPQSWLKELDLSWLRNEISQLGEVDPELPDLGAQLAPVGTEDQSRARLTLSRSWRNLHLRAYSYWDHRDSSETLGLPALETESLVYSASMRIRRWSLGGGGGRGEAWREGEEIQNTRFAHATLAFRIGRFLQFRASYRADTRELLGLDYDLDGYRGEAGLEFQLGRFWLRAMAFELGEEQLDAGERINRGLRWSLSRYFRGWLPIVSSPQRRGVVR